MKKPSVWSRPIIPPWPEEKHTMSLQCNNVTPESDWKNFYSGQSAEIYYSLCFMEIIKLDSPKASPVILPWSFWHSCKGEDKLSLVIGAILLWGLEQLPIRGLAIQPGFWSRFSLSRVLHSQEPEKEEEEKCKRLNQE